MVDWSDGLPGGIQEWGDGDWGDGLPLGPPPPIPPVVPIWIAEILVGDQVIWDSYTVMTHYVFQDIFDWNGVITDGDWNVLAANPTVSSGAAHFNDLLNMQIAGVFVGGLYPIWNHRYIEAKIKSTCTNNAHTYEGFGTFFNGDLGTGSCYLATITALEPDAHSTISLQSAVGFVVNPIVIVDLSALGIIVLKDEYHTIKSLVTNIDATHKEIKIWLDDQLIITHIDNTLLFPEGSVGIIKYYDNIGDVDAFNIISYYEDVLSQSIPQQILNLDVASFTGIQKLKFRIRRI